MHVRVFVALPSSVYARSVPMYMGVCFLVYVRLLYVS